MIISRTPFRISFFGGGTDYPDWYLKHGGAVIATAIDKYCYIMCRKLPPFFDHKYAIRYSRIENCAAVKEIKHPTAREVLKYLGIDHGIEINHDGDLPARSGIGSSSSFTVGLLLALYALKGVMPSKMRLALEAIHIEQDLVKETVGSQDQVSAAFGGFNQIVFLQNGEIVVKPIILPQEILKQLNDHLLLFYTGIKRTASDVAKSYVDNIEVRKRQMRIMHDLVNEAISVLGSGRDILEFGRLLHEAWGIKRSFSKLVSNSEVDAIYAEARAAGALGGKLSGAGGGGFMLLFAPKQRHHKIKERLNKLIHVPFKFDFSGSQIIFYDPELDYSRIERERAQQKINTFKELHTVTGLVDGYIQG
jgi:D-glycero-alpha-D-manno-heptose-7-phosphate kinase